LIRINAYLEDYLEDRRLSNCFLGLSLFDHLGLSVSHHLDLPLASNLLPLALSLQLYALRYVYPACPARPVGHNDRTGVGLPVLFSSTISHLTKEKRMIEKGELNDETFQKKIIRYPTYE